MLCIHERGAAPFIFQVAQCQLKDSKGKCQIRTVKDCSNTVGNGSALSVSKLANHSEPIQNRAEKSCVLHEKNRHGLSQESKLPAGRPEVGETTCFPSLQGLNGTYTRFFDFHQERGATFENQIYEPTMPFNPNHLSIKFFTNKEVIYDWLESKNIIPALRKLFSIISVNLKMENARLIQK